MKSLGCIPARFGSVRFPGKPLAKILGKTLLERTYEKALLCKKLDHIVIATDDDAIFKHAKDLKADVVMTSIDCQNGTDRIQQVLSSSFAYQGFDIIVNIQGDEPCLDPNLITKVIELLENDKKAVAATIATPLKDKELALNPNIVKCVVDSFSNALYFSRSLIPGGKKGFNPDHSYLRHIGLYAYLKDFIKLYSELPSTPLQIAEDLEQLKILENGYRIKVGVGIYDGLDVNEPSDIQKVEEYLCKNSFS